MLEQYPANRPDLKDCLKEFNGNHKTSFIKRRIIVPPEEKNCVLFPARMGIPHKGHIDYMTRILDLDYKLIVSIQRSYSITDRDPLPKWFVMKMVAQSLMAYGYPRESFKIYLTPFYQTPEEVSMHFAMLPEMENNIVAVASNNEAVLKLFPDLPNILQRDVLGLEGEEFIPRSWGEILRGSVKDNDYAVFKEFAAIGVEKVLTFEEIKRLYLETPVAVPSKSVRVVLLSETNREITSVSVRKYTTPEEALVKLFNDSDQICEMVDLYSKDSRIKLDGQDFLLHYEKTEFDGSINIFFKLLKP